MRKLGISNKKSVNNSCLIKMMLQQKRSDLELESKICSEKKPKSFEKMVKK